MKRAAVYIDGSANDAESLTCAVRFCERVGARLKVIHPREPDSVVVPGGGPPSVIDNKAQAEQKANRSKGAFEQVCGNLDLAEWMETREDLPDAIVHNCLLNDVTILERVSQDEGSGVHAFNTALFETAAPVLVAPPTSPATVGKSVIVLWSGTLQSARAVRSAMPMLQQADDVWVLTNAENEDANPDDMTAYLADYGVKSEAHEFSGAKLTARGRGRAMLAAAKELPADLLVMGAYGENKLGVIFGLGRTTQKVVTASPIPLLIQR